MTVHYADPDLVQQDCSTLLLWKTNLNYYKAIT